MYAEFTLATRENIVKLSAVRIRKALSLYAYVPEINKLKGTFKPVALDRSPLPTVKYSEPDLATLWQSCGSYRQELEAGELVQIIGDVEINADDSVRSIENVQSIEAVEPLDIQARLLYIAGLPDGWYENNTGTSFSGKYMSDLADRFDRWYESSLPRPAIQPYADGTIGCEWSWPNGECNLIINPQTDTGEWTEFYLNNDYEAEERLDLNRETDWQWFGERVRERNAEEQA